MSASTMFLSEAALRHHKQLALKRTSVVSSSHMSEGIAAAFGFKTQAALRAAMKGNATIEVAKPDNKRLAERLRDLGYAVPDDLALLPNLDVSYTPFKRMPLRKRRGVRWMAWRNLLVSAINAGLEQRLFGLSPGENWWPNATANDDTYRYRFTVDGDMQAIASVNAISGDELSIHALLCPTADETEPGFYMGIETGAAYAHGWVERRLGAWIQDGGAGFQCKRWMQGRLSGLNIKPAGYADQGSFIM